jgi:predicted P-loop ATPase
MRGRPERHGAREVQPDQSAARQSAAALDGEGDDYWEKNLEQNDKLRIIASLRNVFLILTRDERWSACSAFDEFANQVVKRKAAAVRWRRAGPWDDVDDLRTALWLSQHYRFNPDKKLVMHAVLAAAHERRFHPVREYFEALKWDGTPRLRDLARAVLRREPRIEYCAARRASSS